jgi:hypothetical protein
MKLPSVARLSRQRTVQHMHDDDRPRHRCIAAGNAFIRNNRPKSRASFFSLRDDLVLADFAWHLADQPDDRAFRFSMDDPVI